jgi:tetratricopeptide (TPR) repeat protein
MGSQDTVGGLIQKAYDKLNAVDSRGALDALEAALGIDFDHPEVKYGLKCLTWWLEHIKRAGDFRESYDKGAYILSLWKPYYSFLDRFDGHFDICQFAIRRYVFSAALRYFSELLGDGANEHDPDLLLLVGRCYKGVGDYGESLKYLEQAARFKREDAETLAELADVNALVAENRAAKALFREAFFADPQKIDLRSMESELIIRLRDRVEEMGYGGAELAEWIPVYGSLFRVFSVKRELKPSELGRLKQSIFALENEISHSGRDQNPLLKPRLINRYFWLIDHYENTREDPDAVEDTMRKIKIIDESIYEWYTR